MNSSQCAYLVAAIICLIAALVLLIFGTGCTTVDPSKTKPEAPIIGMPSPTGNAHLWPNNKRP